jgi:excisionase family DNA binding protein
VYTVKETAELLGACQATVRALFSRGVLRGPRLGKRIRISESSLAQFLNGEQTGTVAGDK